MSQFGNLKSVLTIADMARRRIMCALWRNCRLVGRCIAISSRSLSSPPKRGSAITRGGMPSAQLDLSRVSRHPA
jgi:hypothetical protein